MQHPWLDLQAMARAVSAKGSPLDNCVAFLGGTVRPICRPSRNQRLVFNGHKRQHALKFQSLMYPNGLIGHLFRPMSGRPHDSVLLRGSGLMPLFAAAAPNFTMYGDNAYPMLHHLITPYRRFNLTPNRNAFNRELSRVLVSVEWGFGSIIQQFAFSDFKKN